MHVRRTSIADSLFATVARRPTPGGGGVAALAGTLAAAIGETVLSYSVGRKDAAAARVIGPNDADGIAAFLEELVAGSIG